MFLVFCSDLPTKNPQIAEEFSGRINARAICAIRSHTASFAIELPPLRPHDNNPNILLLGEAFGLFVLFEYPNFNSKK